MSWNGVKKQTNVEDIKAWCDEMGIENYTINSKGEIDVDGSINLNVNLNNLNNVDFKELPYKFGKINGYFNIGDNQNLTSLKNCPDYVTGLFACDFCPKLDSLEGCPKEVKRNFWCGNCKRKFTKEEVQSLCKVKGNIYI